MCGREEIPGRHRGWGAATRSMRTYADPPATFVRGRGTLLFDADGKEYLDFITGLAVVSLGHAHPAVADAVAGEQAADAQPRVEPLRQHVGAGGHPHHRPPDQRRQRPGGRAGVLRQLEGRRPTSCALKLARRLGRRWPPRRRNGADNASTAGPWPPSRHRPAGEARPFAPLPGGVHHVPYDDIAALDAASTRPGWPPTCWNRSRGRLGSSSPSDYLARSGALRRAGRPPHASTRSRPGSAGPAAGSASSTRR